MADADNHAVPLARIDSLTTSVAERRDEVRRLASCARERTSPERRTTSRITL
jgi:hypothetical protein